MKCTYQNKTVIVHYMYKVHLVKQWYVNETNFFSRGTSVWQSTKRVLRWWIWHSEM